MDITKLIDFKRFEYNWEAIEAIPEFAALKECKQSPKYHGEGNAFVHTKLVCEKAVEMCKEKHWENEEGYVSLLLTSALFHDIGKGVTCSQGKDGRWHAYGHEFASEKITRRLLWDCNYGGRIKFREDICSLVRYHMDPLKLFESKDILEKIADLSNKVPYLHILFELKRCDIYGSVQENELNKESDFIKMETLEYVATRMDCLHKPFFFLKDAYKNFLEEKKKKTIDVAILIGLPGSGKSTYAKEIKECYDEFKDAVIISRDDIRYELGYCSEGEKTILNSDCEDIVTEEFNKRTIAAAKAGKPVIIDNLNIKRKYRDAYKSLLSNYYVNWHYYYIEAPTLNDNIERRNGQIYESVFEGMIAKLEMPTYDEYTDIHYHLTY